MPDKIFDNSGNLISDTTEAHPAVVAASTPEKVFDGSGNLIHQLFNKPLPGVENKVPPEQQISSWKDIGRNITKSLTPSVTALGVGTGMAPFTGGSSMILPAAGGLLGGLMSHFAMQMAGQGFGEQLSQSPFTDAAEQIGSNELGGMVGGAVYKGFKGLIKPPAYDTINPVANRLGQVYQDMVDKGGGPSYSQQNPGRIKKLIEDIFGGQAKTEQLKNAATAVEKTGVEKINQVTGKNLTSLQDPQDVLRSAGGDLERNLQISKSRSNAAAASAKNIANLNPEQIGDKVVNGPVQLPNAVNLATKYLKSLDENYGQKSTADMMGLVADDQKSLVRTALDLVKYKDTSIPFEAAWAMKQAVGEAGFGKINLVATPKQGQFATLTDAIDSDIDKSFSNWKNGGSIAQQQFTKAKALVNQRHELYQQGDEISTILRDKKVSTSQPAFDAILKDPIKVGRAIEAAGPGGRSEIQTYNLTKTLQDNFDTKKGTFNSEILNDWKDPAKQAVIKKLYNSNQRVELDKFFEAASNVSSPESNSGKVSAGLRIGHATVNLGAGLLSGSALLSGHDITAGTIVGGSIALNQFVKKVLLNPERARAATILMNLPANSPQAKFWSRQIFAGLDGVGIALQTKDGKIKQGEISDGQVKVD